MYLIHLSISTAAVYGAPASGGISRTATCTPRGGGTTAATTGSSTATCTLCGGGTTARNSTATFHGEGTTAATGVLHFPLFCQAIRPVLRQFFLSNFLGLLRFFPLDLWKIYKKQSTINRGTTTMKHTQTRNNY